MKISCGKVLLTAWILSATFANASAQQKEIKAVMTAENWQFEPGQVEFLKEQGKPVMKLLKSRATWKGVDFATGTLSFDIWPGDPDFVSCYFREQSIDERECFYFRTSFAGNPDGYQGIQYAPFLNGVNLWDLLPEYQTGATFSKNQWNHVKMVISEKQMRVFINDMHAPALVVPHLEGNTTHGGISFEGQALLTNLTILPGAIEHLPNEPGFDITDNDARYIRKWETLKEYKLPGSTDFDASWYPDSSATWEPITTERKGMINLTRKVGINHTRKITWLKTTITADAACTRTLRLGFSDDIWVFVNKQLTYVDKNIYGSPMAKSPEGRISLDNGFLELPLQTGRNEIMIALASNFYGWGLIARFDKNEGIHLIR
ncbi:hypothetical protein SAMN05444266_102194 [Chitinophaga jiangningensis]|uniref:3-keto-disaccharide hydrolase domain-containing protein n=1 Tax=Chitinophaga jiangningensis TaxID=1419482 RepID=A0A1M6Y7W3_9BACT|nr:hypothetical protein [Chitinophaga jiangningensis]SHL14374.1 hypothetical protein SAMN05444266_102194 [Chitinophaga jiangningensis]